MTALYLHIPFCESRCIYCDFFSSTQGDAVKERFTTALCSELAARSNEACGNSISTIYFGGGTPSQLPTRQLLRIFDTIHANYAVETDAEITLEANPEDVSTAFVKSLMGMGVNRMSMGVQSFDDKILSFLHRRHNSDKARTAVREISDCGIGNISIDLIYGLPGQSIDGWQKDLNCAFGLPISHLSAYSLTFERETALWRMHEEGLVEETDDEISLRMYDLLCSRCEAEGFGHYEISNFSKPGYHSRHNSSYWNDTPYIGVGPSAHSYDGKDVRRRNASDLEGYIASEGLTGHTLEVLNEKDKYNDFVFTALRTREGLDLKSLEERFGRNRTRFVNEVAKRHLRIGLVEKNGSILRLTRRALFTSDDVISDYIIID